MSCNRKLQVHQRLQLRMAEMKEAIAKKKQSECGRDADHTQDTSISQAPGACSRLRAVSLYRTLS